MSLRPIVIPDVGTGTLDVIEIHVVENNAVQKEQTLLVLESEKTTLEIPAPFAGTIKKLSVKVGDSVKSGQVIGEMEAEEGVIPDDLFSIIPAASSRVIPAASSRVIPAKAGIHLSTATKINSKPQTSLPSDGWIPAFAGMTQQGASIHAGPAVRRLAYELGVNLAQVKSTGPRDRILKEDLHAYIKARLTAPETGISLPEIDFSQWGAIEKIPLTTLAKNSAKNLQRSWSVIPHVTQFEEVDITQLETHRKKLNTQAKEGESKLTVLAFIIKAVALILEQFPKFKASLTPAQDQLILKNYCHIGFAADTPYGLVVPVLRDVAERSLQEIATELQLLSAKARAKKLLPQEMQGGCFTISSLGGLGGTQFTPIVNWPEVAILGVSRSQHKPTWDGQQFIPRLILPLSLSYDHRVIDGADAVRFVVALKALLEKSEQAFV